MSKVKILVECDEELKKSFYAVANSKDLKPSQVLRHLMREYVKNNKQQDLFK